VRDLAVGSSLATTGTLHAMNPYQRLMRRLAKNPVMRWTMSKVMTPLDLMLRNTRFAPSRLGMHAPLCYLTTVGRTSGEPRTVPLLYVDLEPEGRAVVATNWGTSNHPGWALNLEAEPHATLELDGTPHDVVARRATDDEAMAIWRRFDRVWPGYERYREIAPRDIKVFVLEGSATT
jgi:deazaflavin-dependent oxidoreductase (nitroreductase family)